MSRLWSEYTWSAFIDGLTSQRGTTMHKVKSNWQTTWLWRTWEGGLVFCSVLKYQITGQKGNYPVHSGKERRKQSPREYSRVYYHSYIVDVHEYCRCVQMLSFFTQWYSTMDPASMTTCVHQWQMVRYQRMVCVVTFGQWSDNGKITASISTPLCVPRWWAVWVDPWETVP